jgi:hypothetical protein
VGGRPGSSRLLITSRHPFTLSGGAQRHLLCRHQWPARLYRSKFVAASDLRVIESFTRLCGTR